MRISELALPLSIYGEGVGGRGLNAYLKGTGHGFANSHVFGLELFAIGGDNKFHFLFNSGRAVPQFAELIYTWHCHKLNIVIRR